MDGSTWELTRGVDFGAGILSFRNRCYTKASGTGMNATVNVGFMIGGEWVSTKDYDETLVIADETLGVLLERERERVGYAWYGTTLMPDSQVVLWARDPTGDLFAVLPDDLAAAMRTADAAEARVGRAWSAALAEHPDVDNFIDLPENAVEGPAWAEYAAAEMWQDVTAAWQVIPAPESRSWPERFPDTPAPPPVVVKVRFFVHDDEDAPHPVAA